MELSEKTGLPELIEDHFWRVGEVKNTNRFGMSLFGPPSGAYVALVKRVKKTKTRDKIIHLPFGIDFSWGYETFEEWDEEELFLEYVTTSEPYFENVYDDNDEKIGVRETSRITRITGDYLTPELILEFAKKILIRQAEINKARGYLGDYPPKHLDRPELENN